MNTYVNVQAVSITKRPVAIHALVLLIGSFAMSFFMLLQVPHAFGLKATNVTFDFAAVTQLVLFSSMYKETGFGLESFATFITRHIRITIAMFGFEVVF